MDLQAADFWEEGCFFCRFHGICSAYFCNIKTKDTMIHESKIFELAQAQGTFSLEWVSEKGERVKADECQCTSFHSSGATMNVMLFPSKQIRKVNRKTIVAFNGVEVFI